MAWAVFEVIPIHFGFPRLNFRKRLKIILITNHSVEYDRWAVSVESCQANTPFPVEPYGFLTLVQILKSFRELDLHFQIVEDQIWVRRPYQE